MRIGVDLGGTKIECIALGVGGDVLFRQRLPTPRDDYDGTLRAVAHLVSECEHAVRGRGDIPATVGIGHPGAISPATGLIKNANSVWLNGRPLARDLERLLGRPLRLANDANCFALSEAVDGAAAGARVAFGVIIGTGTGGGIVVEGRVLAGPNAIAGEWGHNPLPWPQPGEWPGPSCYCGRTGCIETFLSGAGLLRSYRESAGAPPEDLEAKAIAARAAAGEPRASAALRRYMERMARALAGVVNLLDPDVIVLGGGMSNIPSLYQEVRRWWSPWIFSDRVTTPLVPAQHGDSSGVRGAAWLWPPRSRTDA
jgi:fructokinase